MSSNLCFASAKTPTPEIAWTQLSDNERLSLVNKVMSQSPLFSPKVLSAVEAKLDGQVIIHLVETITADKRGTLLFDLEDFLKKTIDQGLTVWLEALGDRSSLRNLRGIEVKS